MIRTILLGLWVGLVVAGSAIGAGLFALRPVTASDPKIETEYRKMNTVSVPKIAEGTLQGYVVARMGLTLDAKLAKEQKIPPETYIFEDAFRLLYSDPQLDFRHLEAYNIDAFVKQLTKAANDRMKADVVKDIAMEELNFFTKAEVLK
jgi:hypothetical protein